MQASIMFWSPGIRAKLSALFYGLAFPKQVSHLFLKGAPDTERAFSSVMGKQTPRRIYL